MMFFWLRLLFSIRKRAIMIEKPEKEKGREEKKSSGPGANYLQHRDQIPTSPTHPLHAGSHGRSLRDLNNNNGHHYPIGIGDLIPSRMNYMPY